MCSERFDRREELEMAYVEIEVATDQAEAPTMLIDTDVHELMQSKQDLIPYTSGFARKVLEEWFYDRAPFVPNGMYFVVPPSVATRPDWTAPDGDAANRGMSGGHSLEAMQKHLFEAEGITAAILNGSFYPECYPAHFEFAAALASAYNDWQIDNWLDRDSRLYGSVHVVTDDPQVAVREIDRVGSHPQIVQLLLPYTPRKRYGDPIYRPIFEAALRNDLVVAMHQGFDIVTTLGAPRTWFELHTLGAPQLAHSHLMSILAGGVFDQFPELKLVLLETGVVWVPWLMMRADENYKEYRDEVPWVKKMPSDHIRDSVRISTQPLADIKWRDFLTLIEMIDGEDVFVYSLDYPHYDADPFDAVLPPSMPARIRNKLRYENALATYPKLAPLRSLLTSQERAS
jgi:predicted TIM-barrel fold metal-dependent hydrolase